MRHLLTLLNAVAWLVACGAPSQPGGAPASAAAATKAQVYISADRGSSWRPAAVGLPAATSISDLASADSKLVLATKNDGIFVFDPGTGRWQATLSSPQTPSDVDAIALYGGALFAGTNGAGVWMSGDAGKTWQQRSAGLTSSTVRKLVVCGSELYAATNGGLFKLERARGRWSSVFGAEDLQVNGLATDGSRLYLGSQRGVYRFDAASGWVLVLADKPAHNVSVANGSIYAMVYSELFVSSDRGATWQSAQAGMPAGMYTFQVQSAAGDVLAAQWDGVYRMTRAGWQLSAKGLPDRHAVTELVAWREQVVAASSTAP